MDHAARYQLLDHATDESPLWDARHGIATIVADGSRIERHRDRTSAELRPELERLVRDRHVELYEMNDRAHRVLGIDEALGVIADETNWHSPNELGASNKRDTIYALYLTDSGGKEFRQEYAGANPD